MRTLMSVVCWLALSALFGQERQTKDAAPPGGGLQSQDVWTALGLLIGTWAGEGTGDPGLGAGGFSFAWDLKQKILVRKSHADYPATNERPAFSHQDLTIVYQEPGTRLAKAIYFDNEGHVIKYAVTLSEDRKSIVLLSETVAAQPRYRLTYTILGTETVQLSFDIAPPDKPDSFRTYIQGRARRQ